MVSSPAAKTFTKIARCDAKSSFRRDPRWVNLLRLRSINRNSRAQLVLTDHFGDAWNAAISHPKITIWQEKELIFSAKVKTCFQNFSILYPKTKFLACPSARRRPDFQGWFFQIFFSSSTLKLLFEKLFWKLSQIVTEEASNNSAVPLLLRLPLRHPIGAKTLDIPNLLLPFNSNPINVTLFMAFKMETMQMSLRRETEIGGWKFNFCFSCFQTWNRRKEEEMEGLGCWEISPRD